MDPATASGDRARTVQHFDRCSEMGPQNAFIQYRFIRPNDGQVRWIATEARIERSPDITFADLSRSLDITDLAVAKRHLRESEGGFA